MKTPVQRISANYPIEEVLAFRESGYTDQLLVELAAHLDDTWDIYLYFELSRWKGVDLTIEPSPRRKLVLCVCDESPRTNYSFLDQADIVFRMYLPENQRGKIHHLPVGPSRSFVPGELVPFAERPYNVFFSGNLHQGRGGLYRGLKGLPPLPFALLGRLLRVLGAQCDSAFPAAIIRFNTGFHTGMSPQEYGRYLGDSKIVLCPPGIDNPETMRHFEAASQGCLVVTEPLPDLQVYRDAPFVTVSSWRELKPTINALLREPTRMADLHAQTLAWWQTTASASATVSRMLQQLESVGSNSLAELTCS